MGGVSAAGRPARETAEGGWEAAGREGIWGGRKGGEEKFREGIFFFWREKIWGREAEGKRGEKICKEEKELGRGKKDFGGGRVKLGRG